MRELATLKTLKTPASRSPSSRSRTRAGRVMTPSQARGSVSSAALPPIKEGIHTLHAPSRTFAMQRRTFASATTRDPSLSTARRSHGAR